MSQGVARCRRREGPLDSMMRTTRPGEPGSCTVVRNKPICRGWSLRAKRSNTAASGKPNRSSTTKRALKVVICPHSYRMSKSHVDLFLGCSSGKESFSVQVQWLEWWPEGRAPNLRRWLLRVSGAHQAWGRPGWELGRSLEGACPAWVPQKETKWHLFCDSAMANQRNFNG
jgi:hypothetical protein